jgi:hypothetical protein
MLTSLDTWCEVMTEGGMRGFVFVPTAYLSTEGAGAIAPLVTLVQSGTAGQKEQAAATLRILAVNDENKVLIAQADGYSRVPFAPATSPARVARSSGGCWAS